MRSKNRPPKDQGGFIGVQRDATMWRGFALTDFSGATFHEVHNGWANPIVHCKDPIMTTMNARPTEILANPYS